jgi:methyltransferase
VSVPVLWLVSVFLPMLIEARVSTSHERRLRAIGAVEPSGDVYRAMQIAYPAAFLVSIAEGAVRGVAFDRAVAVGAAVFIAAKMLKYWAIGSLGCRWTFRVLVPPGSSRTVRGPYRWLRHPNYVAVAGELAGTAIAMHAMITGTPAAIGFVALMLKRIRIEDHALEQGAVQCAPCSPRDGR